MVSFQCEVSCPFLVPVLCAGRVELTLGYKNCGDVLTKKKLDSHRGHCRGASFSCLDCMVHFQGTEYRSHTVRLAGVALLQAAVLP